MKAEKLAVGIGRNHEIQNEGERTQEQEITVTLYLKGEKQEGSQV